MNQLPDALNLIDGRYRLDVELGAGAFGAVYKAIQIVLGQPMRNVALKLFHGGQISPANVQLMMNDAIQILALLARLTDWEIRQHFVTVFDLGITQENTPRAYVAMELVAGGSLDGRIRDLNTFTLHATHHYMLQIARAMAFMHANRFVHSDLKPANVLVFRGRDQDLVKIGDFGLAGQYEGLFGSGPKGGTMSYMAGEMLQGTATSPAADVFSMGLIAYEMLKGTNPYSRVGHTLDPESPSYEEDLRAMHLEARQEPLRLVPDDFPELADRRGPLRRYAPLLDVINQMLTPDITRRYQSAEGVLAELQRINEGRPPKGDIHAPTGSRALPETTNVSDSDGTVPEPSTSAHASNLLRDEFEGHLNFERWADATRVAAALIRQLPERADPYVLASKVPLKQAARLTHTSAAPGRADRLHDQAIQLLNRGLAACSDPIELRQLRLAIADVYERRGDSAMAAQSRRLT